MQINKNKKLKIPPNAGKLLFWLLALFLLASLLPAALSLEMSSAVIGSAGSITYGEMPSDYMYYSGFESNVPPPYEDGPAKNIIYWVGGGGGDYAAVSSTRSWDVDVAGKASGTSLMATNPDTADSGRFGCSAPRLDYDPGFWQREFYRSTWVYLDTEYSSHGWWQWMEMREYDSASGKWGYPQSSLAIFINGHAPNFYWWFVKGHTPSGYQDRHSFAIGIYDNSWSWDTYPTAHGVNPNWTPEGNFIVNPHPVPWQRWFRLEFYFKRGSYNDGIMTVWITDPFHPIESERDTKILFHIQNVDTSDTVHNPSLNEVSVTGIFKHYGWMGRAYYDEVYAYNYNAHEEGPTTTTTTIPGICTPGNDIIKHVDYPTGSCQSADGFEWSNSTCGDTSVCKESSCKLVDADLTSYTLPSGEYARSDTISISYTIENVGDIPWCFLTETELTKSDGINIWPAKYNSVSTGSSTLDSLSYQISCSDPTGTWTGYLYSYTDQVRYGGWRVWGIPYYSIEVVECEDDQDCVNCLGSDYTCDLSTNMCKSTVTTTSTTVSTTTTTISDLNCDSQCKAQGFVSGLCRSNINGNLLFRSGFEPDVYLDNPTTLGGNQWWQYLRGEDEGYVFPDDLPVNDPTSIYSAVFQTLVSSSHTQEELKNYVETRIDDVIGHDGQPTKALYMDVKNDDPAFDGLTRSQYNVYWDNSLSEAYIRYWIKIQPNLADVMYETRGWRMLMEWYESGRDYRWNIHIQKDRNGNLYWHTQAQWGTLGSSPQHWYITSYDPPPESILGKWFLFEVYWKHSTGDDGRVWVAVNGKTIADYYGRNKKDSGISAWCPFKVYTGDEYLDLGKHYQWIDDFELYDGMPTSISGCQSGETGIGQDGCSSGQTCCCS